MVLSASGDKLIEIYRDTLNGLSTYFFGVFITRNNLDLDSAVS